MRTPDAPGRRTAYTVKQIAALSRVSVRTLHYYDETGLLKPAYVRANGYRYYEEAQLLRLQQILFYRELDFELKDIKRILGRANFEILAALNSHRRVLQRNAARTHRLLATIEKTIKHLKGTKKMKTDEMFEGFSIPAGHDRFGRREDLGGEPQACKLSGQDTGGAICIFEFAVSGGGPRHAHFDQDEWIYVLEGEYEFHIGERHFRAGPGESVFIPRKVAHVWGSATGRPGKVLNVYQPAGTMEEFFRGVSHLKDLPTLEHVLANAYSDAQKRSLHEFFHAHGMDLSGPPLLTNELRARLQALAGPKNEESGARGGDFSQSG